MAFYIINHDDVDLKLNGPYKTLLDALIKIEEDFPYEDCQVINAGASHAVLEKDDVKVLIVKILKDYKISLPHETFENYYQNFMYNEFKKKYE